MEMITAHQGKSREELLHIIEQQTQTIAQQTQQIHSLHEYIRLYRQRQFANKSEKLSQVQLSLFSEAQLPKQTETIEEAEVAISVASHTRKPGRKPLPKDLPHVNNVFMT